MSILNRCARRATRTCILMALLAWCVPTAASGGDAPGLEIEFEVGPVWQSLNDVQVPNDATGTRFSLVDLAGRGPTAGARIYLTWRLSERSSLRALYAPLSFEESGTPAGALDFSGVSFASGVTADAVYKFNSYRLTYSWLWRDGATWDWRVGFTAKVRDARVRLTQGAVQATKDDVGFVPLLHLQGRARLSERWELLMDLDALAGGPGRAEDFAIKLGWKVAPGWQIRAGYRTVEGGADVDSVYAFAWLHYAVASLAIEL